MRDPFSLVMKEPTPPQPSPIAPMTSPAFVNPAENF